METPAVEGSLVEAGASIARLDLRDRQSRVSEMQAAVAQRELEYDAARKLGAKKFQSETQVAQALTQLEAARAALHQAELDLEHVTIEAPFTGVVERRMVEVGDYVEPGDPVAEVIEQDPFLVVGDAPETIVGPLRRRRARGRHAGRRADHAGPHPLRRVAGGRGHPDLPRRARGAQPRAAACPPA